MKNIEYKFIAKSILVTILLATIFNGCAQNETLIVEDEKIGVKSQRDIKKESNRKWALALPKFSLQNKDITKWLLIEDLNFNTRDDDLIVVYALFKNSTSSTKNVIYKIEWIDENGIEFKTMLSNWREVEIYGNDTFNIRAVSPSIKVKDFKIVIKEK